MYQLEVYETLVMYYITKIFFFYLTVIKLYYIIIHCTCTCRCVKLWSTEGYHCLATLEHYAPISTLKLSNLLLISGTARSTPSATTATANKEEERDAVHVWNLHTNSKMITWPLASSSGCFITSFASNGNRVYGGGR